ncbi:hypothetical protein G6M89_11210 [Natronolimnobius sp. AArcel1]|nr:hypothetical protein [Natronolimnobius sp. AArcel1]NGM69566.1 hypothetical protein [Natronolimnobius sp. AArcel1]
MALDEFLEGESLTGRQALLIFFGFLILIIIAALFLIAFSDVFQNLVT